MRKSILLIGLGRFGKNMAVKLWELGHEVMAIDKQESRVEEVLPYVTNAQIGDSMNEAFLKSLGVPNYDVCIVTIGNDFQGSLETTSLLKELGAKMVVSRAERDVQAKFLLRNGADNIVYPEKQLATWAAIRYSADHILDYIELEDDYAIFELAVPDEWVGNTIGEINIRQRYNINIMAIKRNNKLDMTITANTRFSEGEALLVLGNNKDIQKCFRI
ncbi:MAG: TrkA family potassium uptake protein [Lachnospiraceae bacterium]|nr:TrkA family potassium uptake protein [Lachnospiraceae bacterium]